VAGLFLYKRALVGALFNGAELNQDTLDVAAGAAFIRNQTRIVLDRGDPHHLVHRGLASRAHQGAFSFRQLGHERNSVAHTESNAGQVYWLRRCGLFTIRTALAQTGERDAERLCFHVPNRHFPRGHAQKARPTPS
jgi:hypothetical protein